MNNDEQAVEAHVDVVRMQLQAARARRGGELSSAEGRALSALNGFGESARKDGYIPAFDAVITSLGTCSAEAPDGERERFTQMIAYLRGAEDAVLRLARVHGTKPRTLVAPPSPFLAPSKAKPSLHPERVSPQTASRPVEPAATKQIERSARDAIEEIVSLAWLRRTGDREAWTICADFERRLFECLDAVVAYGRGPASIDVVDAAVRFARDFPIVEPARWFVPAFLLACTDGERASARLRQMFLEGPIVAQPALVDALALGSSHRLGSLALSLVEEDERTDLLVAGLGACLRLGVCDEPLMFPLLDHPSDDVARLAVRCLARGERANVAPRLVDLLERHSVALEAAYTLAVFRAETGSAHLRQVIAAGLRETASADELASARVAAPLLALLGQRRDTDALLGIARSDAGGISNLADHGSPVFLEWLRGERRNGSAGQRVAAAEALARMIGAHLPQPEADESHPLIDDAAFVRAIESFSPPSAAERIRLGRKLDAHVTLEELSRPTTRQGVRRRLEREAAVFRGSPLLIDLDGWVGVQARGLRDLRTEKAA